MERDMVIRHIMRMENCTREDAEEILDDVIEEVINAVQQEDYELAEDIWTGDLGLDLDYLDLFMLV